MTGTTRQLVFNYKLLRLLVGLIAGALPVVVTIVSDSPLSSISASYYTDARDCFTGLLCIVGAFLLAYQGHDRAQAVASKVAGFATFVVAWCPTACDQCACGTACGVHLGAASLLFAILTWFCFKPFASRAQKKKDQGEKTAGRRLVVYRICGAVMALCLGGGLLLKLALPAETTTQWRVIFVAELFALLAFGLAWMTAGRCIPLLAEPDDLLNPWRLVIALKNRRQEQ